LLLLNGPRLDHGFATFGRILKMGWMVNTIVFNNLLQAVCAVKRTSNAMDILLRRMPELSCTPDVFSFNILLKGFCDENKSQEALDLLCMMANNGSSCAPDVVSYNTVIHGLCKEGQVDNGYNLFVKWRILGLPWMS
jgi:pentatricopeptide repeat protein